MIYSHTKNIYLVIGAIALLIIGVVVWQGNNQKLNTPGEILLTPKISNIKNLTYIIDGESFDLVNGVAEKSFTPESATKNTLRIFGEPVYGDINGDGDDRDAVIWLQYNPGGSGTFYYVAGAIHTPNGYVPTNTLFLGDRIAPQTIEIGNGRVAVNFAERAPGEPMVTPPSIGKTVWMIYHPQKNLMEKEIVVE